MICVYLECKEAGIQKTRGKNNNNNNNNITTMLTVLLSQAETQI